MRKLVSIFILAVFIAACATEQAEKKINTPMGVARLWLENYYYHNDYDMAKSYSTSQTSAMIDTIRTMIFPDQSGEKPTFNIENVKCKQTKGSKEAVCTCKYLEGGESFVEELHLVQEEGQWLIDAKFGKDEDLLLDDDIEKMTKDFERSLDKLLDQ